ncbi:Pfs domain protein [Talaromyces proteolyticus]|uniref:Pfs domain protein n=1 Tax=Talaromyces proteolyticus TaxID=1131652 RepID=A0AAD4L0B2_9EURO|nr:Pfs domain protein [Talaromyces proteolyticus]KAH8700559.1 Pfs domain protein [Talaromyces proteolyticus]
MAPPAHEDYSIAWICALPVEVAAATAMLDEIHETPPPKPINDPNAYTLGKLNGHLVVIACLPNGIYGTVSAATVMSHLYSTFPHIQFALMVGIGGGVPSKENDIRLGDVVVSKPTGQHSGVIQYDYGKAVQGGHFENTGKLNSPPLNLLTRINQLEADQMKKTDDAISIIVQNALERNPDMKRRFTPPNQDTDYLFFSSYHHHDKQDNCAKCDKTQMVYRQPRYTREPQIHYGLIASGDRVMKDSETRDRLAKQLGIICFEMEAAGLMNQLPTLVIRGICDYCDSHKQKRWQAYSALSAAAYAKKLLKGVSVYTRSKSNDKKVCTADSLSKMIFSG